MVIRHILDNGAVVLIDEMQDVRSFSLGFFVRAGSQDEPAARRGISHFLEHVLFKRTRRRSNVQIARAIDALGGDVDAFTTKEYTGFYVHTMDMRFADALELMGDIVLSPAFDGKDIENERGVILEEIGEANDNPEDLVHEMLVRSFWKGHPLGEPILGTTRSVRAGSRGGRRTPPMMPRPPALLTAATSSAVVYLDIPAWKIGTSIPKSLQTGVWRRAITRVSLYPVWPVVGLKQQVQAPASVGRIHEPDPRPCQAAPGPTNYSSPEGPLEAQGAYSDRVRRLWVAGPVWRPPRRP